MATIIYPTSASVYTRVIDTTGLSEIHIDVQPDLIFVLTGSFPNTSSIVFIQGMDTGSTYPISSSWSLITVSASFALQATSCVSASFALNAVNVTQLNTTNPTKKLFVNSAIVNSSGSFGDCLSLLTFSSSTARADGADIRVQLNDGTGNPSGSYFPLSVNVGQISGSSMWYTVGWIDAFISNSVKNYVITYGDPAASYMYLTQAQTSVLKKRGSVYGNFVVYNDNSQADWYADASWGTIGTRIPALTNDDETTVSNVPPGGFWYNGVFLTSFGLNPNGLFSPTVTPSGTGITTNVWGMNNTDNLSLWCDVVTTSDGWAYQWYNRHNYGQAGSYFKGVVRYHNNGKFVLSIFDCNPTHQANYATNVIQGYVGTNAWAFTVPGAITASNPQTAVAVVIEPYATATVSGSESSYP